MRSAIACIVLVVGTVLGSSAHPSDAPDVVGGVPLPRDVAVATQSVPAKPGDGYLGVWIGSWGGSLRHILVVERLEPDGSAALVYAVGSAPDLRIDPMYVRRRGTVADGALALSGPATVTYRLDADGTLEGLYVDGALRAHARLRRISIDGILGGTPLPWGEPERLWVDGPIEQDQPAKLNVLLFRPEGPGPFPLFVFNHGSTGLGTDPRRFGNPYWNFGIADEFVRRGWIVAFPQRRGRGGSSGLYDEGFADDRSRGYTCEAPPSLRGAERALTDVEVAVTALRDRADVASRPILIGGQSRGGILAVAYAGHHPEQVLGVINFVGGWLGAGCGSATAVNADLARQGSRFGRPTLWLYGGDDPYYPLAHTRGIFDAFKDAGGSGSFLAFTVPGAHQGHALGSVRHLWRESVAAYLDHLSASP